MNSSFKTAAEFKIVFGLCIFSKADIKSKTTHAGVHKDLTIILEKVGNHNPGVLLLPY